MFRSGGWVECLVLRERERWLGRGDTEDAALEDALAAMLPSHAARMLLASAVTEEAEGPISTCQRVPARAPEPEIPAAAPEPEIHGDALITTLPFAAPPPEPAAPAPEPALTMPAPEPAAPIPEARAAIPEVQLAASPLQEPQSAPPPEEPRSAPVPEEIVKRPSLDEALADLDKILRGVEDQLSTFARLAPLRQRTLLLLWICRARAFEDALPHERDVQRRIGMIARRLTELAKTFWPGSVRALQMTARPWDLPELRLRGATAPRTWTEAVGRAEHILAEQLAEAEHAGLDDDGWVRESGSAAEGNGDQALTTASTAIDSALAPMRDNDDPDVLDAAAVEALTNAAKRLRRARRRVTDGVAWGVVMGRLRRLAPGLGARGARLREVLESEGPAAARALTAIIFEGA
ncbi:MAG: hypothetical protein QM820_59810 [Minicystis sp.]